MSDTHESLDAILAEMRGIAGNMETAARKFDVEHRQDKRCLKHPHCFRADDLLRDANGLRDWADRIEAAAERETDAAIHEALANVTDYAPVNAAALREALVEILDRTNREKTRDYDAALNGGILEIHDIANTALDQTKGE